MHRKTTGTRPVQQSTIDQLQYINLDQ